MDYYGGDTVGMISEKMLGQRPMDIMRMLCYWLNMTCGLQSLVRVGKKNYSA